MRKLFSLFLVGVCAVSLALFPAEAQQIDGSAFKGLRWRQIGPFRGGRAIAVAGVPGDPTTFYFGAVAGGVWKTTDGGLNWSPIFDNQSVASIGAMAVAPSDPNIVYVGTGEACIRGNISHGDGVYKSTDAGKTWQHIGLHDTRHIGALVVHPRDSNLVFVAALGHVYGPNSERGVFRSADGGKTWTKVLFMDDKTGAIDITFAPKNPLLMFAALWEAGRTPYRMTSGGPGSGFYRSTDGGLTWKRLEDGGLPRGILGRIGVSVSGADTNRVYAMIEAEDGGLFVSNDGGDSWRRVNEDRRLRQRAWYYTHVIADPQQIDTVYVLNTGFYRSADGGRTFSTIAVPHGDNHGLWIDPTEPLRMINANDGGANVTVNGGRTWTRQDTQPTAQFYHVITDNQFPYHIYGAQQDNSTVAIASRTDDGVIDRRHWYTVGGCESGYIAPHPRDPNIVYAGCYGGSITRFDKRTGQAQEIMAWPENPMGHAAADLKHRWQWTAPIVFSPHDPNVLYHAAEVLFKTTNEGMSWTPISRDLTRNDKSRQGPSGGPLTKDNTSVEYYNTIFAVAESPRQKDLIWVGTDDGLVHITRDAGKTWTDVTPKDLPEWSLISLVEPSPHDAATAYIAVDRHELDDFRPYIYKTSDFGKTWTKIVAGIPDTTFVRAVREDPVRRGLLFAGTETGVFVSFDDGARWQSLQLNLPTAPIHDLAVKEDDLVVATHGRSFWVLDNITPLQQLNAQVLAADAHLYRPRATLRTRAGGGFGAPAGAGENPPSGATIYYWLQSEPKDEVTLEILDAQGTVLRKFAGRAAAEAPPAAPPAGPPPGPRLPVGAGLQRFVWNLRLEGSTVIPGAVHWGGNPATGPMILPGHYQAKLTVAGQSQTAPLEIQMDPRVTTSPADLQKQFDLLQQIRAKVTETHDAVIRIRDLRAQLTALKRRLAGHKAGPAISAAADAIDKKMSPVEEQLIQVRARSTQDLLNFPVMLNDKLLGLFSDVDSADRAPTAQAFVVFKMLATAVDTQLAVWNQIVAKNLPALNDQIRRENIPLIELSAPRRP
jgi:photosystem II stability/assembly factor-like uncharacterized protein